MSIQIVPRDALADGKTTAGNIPPVLFANLKTLYQRRADRLRKLAEDSPLDGYLNFAAAICDAQQRVLSSAVWTPITFNGGGANCRCYLEYTCTYLVVTGLSCRTKREL